MSIREQFRAQFIDPARLAAFITLATSHGGRVVPERTKLVDGTGMVRGSKYVSVTVEVPFDTAAESFKLCAVTTGLIEDENENRRRG